MIDKNYYELPNRDWWHGRIDGENINQLRWHQIVEMVDLNNLNKDLLKNNFVILGFACDEGVERNKGRIGAANAPKTLRGGCSNLPIHFSSSKKIIDVGNIFCANKNLETTQIQLADAVSILLNNNGFPILFGGGHEIVYGHYNGIKKSFPDKKIGIINFDAHFDLRSTINTCATSGTGFYQIAEDCKRENRPFNYLAIGVQEAGNTKELFERANALKAEYIFARNFHYARMQEIEDCVENFIDKVDVIYITIDMDVFASAYAPGVSAITANGLVYDLLFYEILKQLTLSKKVISIDVAELNPKYDIDNRTAKLAANIAFDFVNLIMKN